MEQHNEQPDTSALRREVERQSQKLGQLEELLTRQETLKRPLSEFSAEFVAAQAAGDYVKAERIRKDWLDAIAARASGNGYF